MFLLQKLSWISDDFFKGRVAIKKKKDLDTLLREVLIFIFNSYYFLKNINFSSM